MIDGTWADPSDRPGYQRARLRDALRAWAHGLWLAVWG